MIINNIEEISTDNLYKIYTEAAKEINRRIDAETTIAWNEIVTAIKNYIKYYGSIPVYTNTSLNPIEPDFYITEKSLHESKKVTIFE